MAGERREVWLYDDGLTPVAVLREYASVIFTRRYYEHSSWSGRFPVDTYEALEAASYLQVAGDDECYLIEKPTIVRGDDGALYADCEGRSATALLHTRAVIGQLSWTAKKHGQIVSDLIATLTGDRAIPHLTFGTGAALGVDIDKQLAWDDMGESVRELLASGFLGMRARFTPTSLYEDTFSRSWKDNFERTALGENYTVADGAVSISNGQALQTNGFDALTVFESPGILSHARVRIDARQFTNSLLLYQGPVLGYQDVDNHYRAVESESNPSVRLVKCVGGVSTELGSSPALDGIGVRMLELEYLPATHTLNVYGQYRVLPEEISGYTLSSNAAYLTATNKSTLPASGGYLTYGQLAALAMQLGIVGSVVDEGGGVLRYNYTQLVYGTEVIWDYNINAYPWSLKSGALTLSLDVLNKLKTWLDTHSWFFDIDIDVNSERPADWLPLISVVDTTFESGKIGFYTHAAGAGPSNFAASSYDRPEGADDPQMIYIDVIEPAATDISVGERYHNAVTDGTSIDEAEWRNYAIVRGEEVEGVTPERVDVDFTSGSPRREVYVDASDIARTVDGVTMGAAAYRALLAQRGAEVLSDLRRVENADAQVSVPLSPGDVAWYDSKKWSAYLMATEVETTYEKGTVAYRATLGEPTPTLRKTLRRAR